MTIRAHPSARLAVLTVVILSLVYAAAAFFAVPGIHKTQELARTNAYSQAPPPAYTPAYLLAGVWQRFDTNWYLQIAASGYPDPRAVVFYPFYPLLIRGLSFLGFPPLWAALLIARLATVVLLWGLLELLQLDLSPAQSRWSLAWMLVWPSGFMLFAAYPDSLMLALAVWSFLLARGNRWWPAALCAALACTTKAAGAAVVLALAYQCWRHKQWRLAPLSLAALGAAIYPSALYLAGLPQPAAIYPIHWRTTPALPWDTLWSALRGAAAADPVLILDLLCLLSVALLVWRARLHSPWTPAYTVYSAALLVLFLAKKTDPLLQSTMRYLLAVFPAFAGLGQSARDPYARTALLTILAALHLAFVFAFWMWSLVV
jgi:hypothetical protein